MIYLKSFKLLDAYYEGLITEIDPRRIYNSYYPLGLFPVKGFENINFSHVTIFYGGNGSGKSTLLNIIAEKLEAMRKNPINKGNIFSEYVHFTNYEMTMDMPDEIKIVTSDDVFDYLLNVRSINSHINRNKEFLSKEYVHYKYNSDKSSIQNFEDLRNTYESKRKTMSKYVRERLGNNNIVEHSNGESALEFWENEIKENALYILDEPENSLSAENQKKLQNFIFESVRFYNCQFIICTHSPFLLSIPDALIYDLDEVPVSKKKWTDLGNVRVYYDFFKEHDKEFK